MPLLGIMWKISHRLTTRTTLTLDDDILEIAARQAKLRGASFSKTVSDLVRRGLSAPTPSREKGGKVFSLKPTFAVFTTVQLSP